MLATGQKMHITSPNGTDLTVQLGGRPVFADDGVISAADQQEKLIYNRTARLPGGLLYGTCLENSATGRLAASTTQLMNQNLTGFKADVQNGQLTNLRAEAGGEAFKEWLAPTTTRECGRDHWPEYSVESHSSAGAMRAHSSLAVTKSAPGRVDSPPKSKMCTPASIIS